MAFCENCGTEVKDDVKFCPTCGTERKANQNNNNFTQAITNFNNTQDSTTQFDPADIQKNKAMAILAYIGILVLIPIFAAKDSKFARYHSNQGLVLLIFWAIYSIASNIVGFVFALVGMGFIGALLNIVSLAFLALAIIGIVNAANGQAKELPVIGSIRILK